jgi:hypothetical protein
MDISDFLNSLRDLIVLLPVVILILGPMLVRLIRRRQRGAGGEPPVGRKPESGKRAAGETAPATLRKQSPIGLMRRRATPPAGEGRRAPVALRVTREQVFRRAEAAEAWPRAPETPAVSPGEPLAPHMAKMQSSLDQRAQLRESVIDEVEKPRVRSGRSRLNILSPLKRAILWAEILGRPKGW